MYLSILFCHCIHVHEWRLQQNIQLFSLLNASACSRREVAGNQITWPPLASLNYVKLFENRDILATSLNKKFKLKHPYKGK